MKPSKVLKIVLLSMSVLVLGVPACMAKNVTMISPVLRATINDSSLCFLMNNSSAPIDMTINIVKGDGTGIPFTTTVNPGTYGGYQASGAAGDFHCVISFHGSSKSVRAVYSLSNGGTLRPITIVPVL